MGLYQPKPYQKLNRSTGRFEWVYPEPMVFISGIEGGRGGKLKQTTTNTKKVKA